MKVIKLKDIISIFAFCIFLILGAEVNLSFGADGDFAIYREVTGTELVNISATDQTWDTTVAQGSEFSIDGTRTLVTLNSAGHYLVMYNLALQTAGGSYRSEMQTILNLGGADIPYGRSSGYIRRSGGTDECFIYGAAVIETIASNNIKIISQRTDSNTATVSRYPNQCGFTLLKLSEQWDYARIKESGGGQVFNSAAWSAFTWDTNDELDTGSFTHTGDTDAITLKTAGHYLVTVNVHMQTSGTGTRTNGEMRLTLNGIEIDGTRTTAYIRETNSTNDHSAVFSGIIETTAVNQILRVECRRESELGTITTAANQSGISIVKLNDSAEYIRLGEIVGNQAVDGTNDPILWDEELEVNSASFNHTSNQVNIQSNGDYLFFSTFYSSRPAGDADRIYPYWQWRKNAAKYQYGGSGKYNRGDQGTSDARTAGNSLGIIANGLITGNYIDLVNTDESTGTDANCQFKANLMGLQAVRLASLFPPPPVATITVTPSPTKAQSAGGLEIKLVFDMTMNTSVEPVVSYDPAGVTGAQVCTGGTWSTTTNQDDTYTVYNDLVIDAATGDGTAAVIVTSAQSSGGGIMADDSDDTFVIDTVVPTNPTAPCGAWDSSGKTTPLTDDTWQELDDTPYFEWTGADDIGGTGVSGYSVYWGTDPIGEPGLSQEQVNANYDVLTSTGDGSFYLRIRTFDNAGNYSNSITLFLFKYDAGAPLNPTTPCSAWETNLKVVSISDDTWQEDDNTPYLEWTGASDSGGSGVSGYSVYWGTNVSGEPGTTKEQGSNSYEVISPTVDGTYYLRVRTFDNLDHYSTPITLFTFKYDETAPTNPTAPCSAWDSSAKGTIISDNTAQGIDQTPYFEWTGADDGAGEGVNGYSVYWGSDSSGEPGITQEQATANYDVLTSTGQGTFYLRVRTFDALGHYSDPVTIFTFIYDASEPTVSIGILPSPAGHRDVGELEFTLVFSESMDTGTAPVITYDPQGATGAQTVDTSGVWSTTANTDDTYTVYNSSIIDSNTGDGTATISVSAAQDIAGNTMVADTDDTFVIDTSIHHFVIAHDGSALVDTAEDITITAKNITNCTVLDFTGQITASSLNETGEIAWTLQAGNGVFNDDGLGVDTATYTYDATDNGVVVLQVSDTAADNLDIEVTDSINTDDDTEGTLVVSTTALGSFVITHDNAAVAGTAETITITAKDTGAQTKTDYVGTVTLDTNGTATAVTWALSSGLGTFNDDGPSADTATYTFHDNDNGVAVFTIKDTKVETINISVSDGGSTDDDSEGNLVVSPGAVDNFIVAHDAQAIAGIGDNVTVTAYDAYNNVKTDYTGTITVDTNGTPASITWALQSGAGVFNDGGASVDTATYTYDAADNGAVTFTVNNTKTESIDIDVSGDSKTDTDTEGNLVVWPAVIDHFVIAHDNSASAGVSEQMTVTASDSYGNTKTDYQGTISFDTNGTANSISWALIIGNGVFNDGGAGVDTATYTYDAADNGTATFSITDISEETINISVSGDTKTDDDTEGDLVVGSAVIWAFDISHDNSGNAGVPEVVTITAKDSIGGTKTDYTGTITLDTNGTASTIEWALQSGSGTFNDGGPAVDTAIYTYDTADNGVATFTIKDNTVEAIDIDVSGDGRTDDDSEGNLVINSALLEHFLIAHDKAAIAGVNDSITITAIDTLNQTKTDYTGIITVDTDGTADSIAWSLQSGNGIFNDGGAGVDTATYTFAAADNGVTVLNMNDTAAETIDISVSGDTKIDDDTEGNMAVFPGALDKFTIYHDGQGLVDVAEYITIKAWDAYLNQKTDYTGTITVDTNGTPASIAWALQSGSGVFNDGGAGVDTATYTYVAGDTGVVVLKITDSTEETINIAVTGGGKSDDNTEGDLAISSTGSTLDMNWLYRRRLTVGAAISGYTVNIVLDGTTTPTASEIYNKALSSGDDLRIGWDTGAGIADIDRHLVTFSSSKIDVWFRIQEAGGWAGGLSDYYIYYGNTDAVSPPENKDNVYLFFDDFNRANSSSLGAKWTVQDNPTMCGISSNRLYLGDDVSYTGQDVVVTANGTGGKLANSGILIQVNFMGNGSAPYQNSFVVIDWTTTANMYTMGARIGANAWRDETGYSTNVQRGIAETINSDLWHQMQIYIPNTTGTTQFLGKLSTDASLEDKGLNRDFGTLSDTVVGLKVQNAHSYYDDFLVRYKAATEPVLTASATEENLLATYLSVAANSVITDNVGIGASDNLILDIILTNNWGKDININSVKLDNTGTALDSEISLLRIYYDSNNSSDYSSGVDSQIGSGTFSSNTKTFSSLSIDVPVGGSEYLFAVLDISSSAEDGKILDAQIPIDGMSFSNGAQVSDAALNSSGQRELDIILDHFVISHDNASVAGTLEQITITAKDSFGNTKTDYAGTIDLDTNGDPDSITWSLQSGNGTFNDHGAGVDTADYTFDASDNGVVVLNISDTTAETINISVSGDTKTDDDTEGDLVVAPGLLDHFVILHDNVAVAGIGESVTVTAKDVYENTISDYSGQITLDTNGQANAITWALSSGFGAFVDGGASVDTATYTFSPTDNGQAVFTITDNSAQTINISVSGDGEFDDNSEGDLAVAPAAIDYFVIVHDNSAQAGVAEEITITAKDALDNTKTDYAGQINIDTNGSVTEIAWALQSGNGAFVDGGASEDTATYTFDLLDNGVSVFTVTDSTVETINVSVIGDTKADDDSEGDLEVVPGALDHFVISHDTVATTGVAETITITAYDANDNIKEDYLGTITLDTTGTETTIRWVLSSGNGIFADGGASVDTAAYTFDALDSGVVVLSVIDHTAETVNISAAGDGKADDDTEGDLQFVSSGIDHFEITHDGNAISSIAENIIIYAKDANGDTLTNYQGQINIDTTGTAAAIAWANVSGDGVFVDDGAGVDTASYTFDTLDDGQVTLAITDTAEETINISVSGEGKTDDNSEGDLIVNPSGLHHFTLSHDGSAAAGIADAITITAKDANDNTITNYTGQITVDTNGTATAIAWAKQTGQGSFVDDGSSVDTATYNFVAGDNGVCVLNITDTKVEIINIAVTGGGKSDDDTEGNINVGPGDIDYFAINHDNNAVAGVADNIVVVAKDAYDNVKTDYTGQITVDTNGTATKITWAKISGAGIFNDGGASVDTATYTYDATDNGTVTLSITDTVVETINISVSGDGQNDDDSEGNLIVAPAAIDYFIISHDTAAVAGVAEVITITAYDSYANVKNDYSGQITLDTTGTAAAISWTLQTGNGTFNDDGAGFDTADYTYHTADNGVVVLTISDTKTESININVSGDGKTDDNSEGSLVVGPANIDHFIVSHDTQAVAGVADNITITAYDEYLNIKDDYTGTITVDTDGNVDTITWANVSGAGVFNDGGAGVDTATYAYDATDNGAVILSIVDTKTETIDLDVLGAGKSDTDLEGNMEVKAAGIDHFTVFHDGSGVVDINESITIYARDAFENTKTDYTGQITVDTNGTTSTIAWALSSGAGTFNDGGASADTATYTYVGSDLGKVILTFTDSIDETVNISVSGSGKTDDDTEGNLVINPVGGTNTGNISPTANSGAFTNATNAYADGGGVATSSNGQNAEFYNYGFNIPTGSIILGIELRLDAYADGTTGIYQYGVELSWDGGTTQTISGNLTPDMSTGEVSYVLGGPTEDWGRTWTVAELSNANFRVKVDSTTRGGTYYASLDWIPVKIYYEPPPNAAANAVITDTVTAGQTDVLICDVTLTNNGTQDRIINSVALDNVGTAVDSEITSVKLYYDSDNSGDYSTGIDQQVGSGTFASGTKVFLGLNITIPGSGTEDLFVVLDTATVINDADTLDVQIPINGIGFVDGAAIEDVILNSTGTRAVSLALDHFVISHDNAAAAGVADNVTVTAKDAYENTKISYTGTITLDTNGTGEITWTSAGLGTFNDNGAGNDTAAYTFVGGDNGSVIFTITDEKAETINIAASGSGKFDDDAEGTMLISAGALDHFDVAHDNAAQAGVAEQITVTANDIYQNKIYNYTGTITLDTDGTATSITWGLFNGFGVFNDGGVSVDTATYTFNSSDNSMAVFTLSNTIAESINIGISGDGKTDKNDEGNLVVSADILDHFVITHDNSAQAGIAENITIMAKDQYENTLINYTGQISLDTNGTATSITWANVSGSGVFADGGVDADTATYTYITADNGAVTLSLTDISLENLNISISGDSKIDDETEGALNVGPGLIEYFAITHDGYALQNQAENIVIKAYDAYNNLKTDYTGTITLDTDGTAATIGWLLSTGSGIFNDGGVSVDTATYTYNVADNGSVTLTMTDTTAEIINISVAGDAKTDNDNEGVLEVVAAGFHHFKITHDGNAVANIAEPITITAKDASDVTVTNYVGTMNVDTNGTASAIAWALNNGAGVFNDDGAGVDTATYTFDAADNGVVILDISNTQTETLNISASGSGKIDDNTEGNLVVNPVGLHHFTISHDHNAVAGVSDNVTITANDANNNPVTNYTGSITVDTNGTAGTISWAKVSGSGVFVDGGSAVDTATYTFDSADNGIANLSIADTKAEIFNISVTGDAKTDDNTEGNITVVPSVIDHFVIVHDGAAEAGVAESITITVKDAYANTITNYTGQITVDTDGTETAITWANSTGSGVFVDGGASVDSATYTFDSADNGVVTLTITDTKLESLNISVNGDSKTDDDTEGTFPVGAGALDKFIVSHDNNATAGTPESVTIIAYDVYSNIKTNYTGSVTIDTNGTETTVTWVLSSGFGVFNDGGASVDTATYGFVGADNGVATFTINDTKAESIDIDVSGNGKFDDDSEGNLVIYPAELDHFNIFHDNSATAGVAEDIIITASDIYNNPQNNYIGQITLDTDGTATTITWANSGGNGIFNDGGASVDTATYTYDAADNGQVTLTINDTTAQAINISVSGNSKFDDDTEGLLTVNPDILNYFVITHDGSAVQSVGEQVTVKAKDQYGNTKTNYTGTITLDTTGDANNISWALNSGSGSFADGGSSVDTATYAYAVQDAGIASFDLTDNTAETLNISVSDGGIIDDNTEGDLVVQASSVTIDIIANDLSSGYIGQAASGYVLLDLTLTNNNVISGDTVQTLTLTNAGTISDAQVSAVKLYYDSNNSGNFEPGTDSQVGTQVFSSGSAVFNNINVSIPIAGTEEFYVTVDLAGTVTNDATVDISVPVNGFGFLSSPDAEDSILNSQGSYIVDSGAPGNVSSLSTTSHPNAISAWNDPQSKDNTVTVNWSPATDSDSGLDGYSVFWDNSPTTLPDAVKDIEQSQNLITSTALASGNTHYVHIRSVDNVGNWAATAENLGPFYIDTQTPTATSIYQITEYAGGDYLSVSGNTIYYSGLAYSAFRVYVAASDAESGLKEAQFPTTTSAGGTDATEDAGSFQYFYTYEISTAGLSYNNVNAVVYDNAGNPANVPFSVILDNTAPGLVSTLSSSSHTVGLVSIDNDITFTWSDVSDSQSGVAGYSIVVDTSAISVPPKYINVAQGVGTYTENDLNSATYYAHIRSVDNVGNWSSTVTHAGPYIIGRGVLSAAITSSNSIVSTGQQFTVTMSVNNTGSSQVQSVDPSTLSVNATGGASATTSSNPVAQNIDPAVQKQYLWIYTAGETAGTVSFKGYAQGIDAEGAIDSSIVTSNDVTVEEKANLTLSVSASPSIVNTNENITITVTVSNTGQADALNVAPLLTPSGSANPVIDSGPSPATSSIKGGRSKEFTYIAHGTGEGVAVFTADIAQGVDENSNIALTATTNQDSVTVEAPPSYELTSLISGTPASVQPSDTITVTMNVQNTGNTILNNITPSSLAVGGSSSDAIYATGPVPASVSTLAAGASQQFTWTYTAGNTLGIINFTGNADATEASSSSSSSGDITLLIESAALTSAIAATPSSLLTNATITVTMTVSNTAAAGAATAEDVIPSVLTLGGTSAEANLLTGPSPSSANIAPQAQQDFVWTYKAGVNQGTVNFTGNASGVDSSSQADVSSASNASANVIISTLNADWIYPSGSNVLGPIRSIPIAYWGMENKIYIGSDDNSLYILNGDTHELDTSFTSSGKIRGLPYPSTDIDGADLKDIIYFGTVGKTVYGLWADNTLRWSRVMGEPLTTTVLYDYVSGVYFGTTANNIYCIDAADGTDSWGAPAAVGGAIESSPAMIYVPTLDYDEIYFGASDGKVYGFKAIDGTGARVFDTGLGSAGAIKTAPTITLQNPSDGNSRRLMLFGTANGKFYAVNTANLSASSGDTGWTTNPISVGGAVYSAPWFDTTTRYVFFGCEDGKLYAVSIADGSMKANFPVDVGSPIDSWPLVENGIVYFGADNGNFYAVDVDTGQIVSGWPYDTGDAIKGGAALHLIYNTETWDVEETYVIVGSDSGRVYSFKAVR